MPQPLNKEELRAYNQKINYEFLQKHSATRQLYGFIQAPQIPSDKFYEDRGADFSSIK